MALYDNNNLLAAIGGQNLGLQTPLQTLQNYQSHGQSLLDEKMPQTMYSPWQAVAYALGKFEGRNEQDSAANIERERQVTTNNQMPMPSFGFNPTTTGSLPSVTPTNGDIAPTQSGGGTTKVGTNMPYVDKLIQIESGGDPNARSGSYRGLGQFGPTEEREYGINDQNRTNPEVQVAAINAERANIDKNLTPALGRPPTDGEAYLAHQQGVAGATSLLTNPNEPAWKAIRPYTRSDAEAKAHVEANIPSNSPLKGMPVDQVKASDFSNLWTSKFGGSVAPSASAVASAQPNAVQSNAAPQAPAQTPNAPTQSVEPTQGTSPITTGSNPEQPSTQSLLGRLEHSAPPVEPPYSAEERNLLSNLPPEYQKNYAALRKQAWTPQTFDTGVGTLWKLPNGRMGFVPHYNTNNVSIGDLHVPSISGINLQTGNLENTFAIPGSGNPGAVSSTGGPGAASGSPPIQGQGSGAGPGGPPNPNGVPSLGIQGANTPNTGNPQIDNLLNLRSSVAANTAQNEANKAALTKRATDAATEYGNKFDEIKKAGLDAQIASQTLQFQRGILDNPQFYSGAGANKLLDLGKVTGALHLNPEGITDTSKLQQLYTKARANENLGTLHTLRGLGQVRNSEVTLINEANGDLSNSVDTNKAINEINQRVVDRAITMSSMARDYARTHGGLDIGWDDTAANYMSTHPLFTDDEISNFHNMIDKDKNLNLTGPDKTTAKPKYFEGQSATAKDGSPLKFSAKKGWMSLKDYQKETQP